MIASQYAGKPVDPSKLINVPRLVTAYYSEIPNDSVPSQRVSFGNSGHRGSALLASFNEWHVLALTQAICEYRAVNKISGPLFLGKDTHALSEAALASAIKVLAGNGVNVMLAVDDEYTPTPVISHAILSYNRGRDSGFADGIVATHADMLPHEGGFKYNPPHGGPADKSVADSIGHRANQLIENGLCGVRRVSFDQALRASTTHRYDYLNAYVADLANVIDMDAIRDSKIRLAVDPLGGAGVHYWEPIADRYGLDLSVINKNVDPTFSFLPVDWDDQIRMDPTSPFAVARLVRVKNQFDVSFACDADHDRQGIITNSSGLLAPHQYLAVAIFYLSTNRPGWDQSAAIGKTVACSQLIDRVAKKVGRKVSEVPPGFFWYADGFRDGSLGIGGDENGGLTFLRRDGREWTTDRDGIVAALLSAEITARSESDPGEIYQELVKECGDSFFDHIDVPVTHEQHAALASISKEQVQLSELVDEKIQSVLIHAPENGRAMGGLKVITENGWFAAFPACCKNTLKIYAESFRDLDHLQKILHQGRQIVSDSLSE